MKKIFVNLIALSLMLSPLSAFALDVNSEDVTCYQFIKVSTKDISGTNFVKFEYCDAVSKRCNPIGTQEYYAVDQLRETLKSKVYIEKVLGGITFTVAALGTALMAVASSAMTGSPLGGILYMGAVTGTGGLVLSYTKPEYSFRDVYSESVITDLPVKVKNISEFANALNKELNLLD